MIPTTPVEFPTLRFGAEASLRPAFAGFFRQLFATIGEWHRRQQDRAALATLTARELRDIGITRVDALNEINKPFWRP